MEGSHHGNQNIVMYSKGAVHRTEIGRPFLAAKGFNNYLRHFLLAYDVTISNIHIYSLQARFPTCMNVHLNRVCMNEILCTKNYN